MGDFMPARVRTSVLLALGGGALFAMAAQARAEEGGVSAATATIGAPAAVEPPSPDSTLFGEVVVTGSRHAAANVAPTQALLTAVEPQSVVTKRFIDDFIPVSGDYSQTIKFTPSFSFSAPNGAGGSESKSQVLRGFADGQYNVTIDGIPFGDSNDFTHHTTSFFPAGVLGSVVVDRGPGQADTVGYATFGGTVALHSRSLTDDAGGLLEGSAGSFGDRVVRGEVQSGALNATGTRFLVDYLYHRTDGALDFAGLHTQQVVFKLEQPLGPKWDLGFFASYNHTLYDNWAQTTPLQTALYGKDFGALNDNPRSILYRDYNLKSKQTDVEYVQLKGELFSVSVENKLYTYGYQNKERNGDNQTNLGLVPAVATSGFGTPVGPKGNLDVRGNRTLNDYRDYGDIFDASKAIAAGLASGVFRTGIWWEHQDNHRQQNEVDWTLGGVPVSAPGIDPTTFLGKNALGQTGVGATLYDLQSTTDTVQPFVEYVWKPLPNVEITPGYKHVDFRRHLDGPVNQTALIPVDTVADYSANLGYITGNWRILPSTAVYGEVAQGFLAPNANTLYTPDLTRSNFQPQKTLNYQTGVVYTSSRLIADVDLYYIDFNNFITTATDFSVTPNESYSINGGGVIYKGVEAEGTLVLGYGLSLFAGGSVNSAKTKGSNRLQGQDLWVAGAPDYTAALGPIFDNHDFYASLLTKRVGTRYFGANRTNLTPNNGQLVPTAASEIVDPVTGRVFTSNRLAPYQTTDLTVGYRFTRIPPLAERLRVEFQVQNLFNSRRATDGNGRLLAGRDAVDPANSTFQYLSPRAYYGSLTLEF